MFSMTIENVVNAIVRQELDRKGREKEALHFQFDLLLHFYSDKGIYEERSGLHLLYYLRPGFGSISVFSAITDSAFTKVKDVKEWEHEITHDSCWRNLTVFSSLYFDMANKINAAMKQDGLPEVAPIEMTEHNNFSLFGPAFDWVPVEIRKDEADTSNYHRMIRVL